MYEGLNRSFHMLGGDVLVFARNILSKCHLYTMAYKMWDRAWQHLLACNNAMLGVFSLLLKIPVQGEVQGQQAGAGWLCKMHQNPYKKKT